MIYTKRDIVLTGVPRSGTTLTCYLLNKAENVVALVEPLNPQDFTSLNDSTLIKSLDCFFKAQRASILKAGKATSRSVSGKVTDNVVSQPDQQTGRRVKLVDSNTIYINKNVSDNFLLFVKHPSFFSAKLNILNKYYKCYAIIRNPLSVLLSWNSVEMAVTDGYAPAAENNDHRLKKALASEKDKINRQLFLLSWFYEQYFSNLTRESIIKYEDIISSNGLCLSEIIGENTLEYDEPLFSRNNSSFYDAKLKGVLKEKLLLSDGAYWKYYDRNSIEF